MMNAKKIALLMSIALGWTLSAQAQNYSDVLRYSQKFNQGTARSFGVANAMGALGADYTAIDINPAGLGIFRRSEFNFSLGLNHQRAVADYLGNSAQDDKYNLNISNIGFVIASLKTEDGKPVKHGLVSLNWGIGFQRTNNFHSNIAVEGTNTQNSILSSFKENANGHAPSAMDQFSTGFLAYQTYLLDPASSDTTQYTEAFNHEKPGAFQRTFQTDYINSHGAMNTVNVGVAGNFSNRCYFGANLEIPTVGYHYVRTFTETNTSDTVGYYNSGSYQENINTSGVGISASFGLIYRVNDNLRLGAAVHAPSFLSLNDEYTYTMTSKLKLSGYGNNAWPTDIATTHYSIVTPAKVTLSGAYLFEKFGFISVDYDYIDYSSGRINTAYEGSRAANKIIESHLKAASNLRIGAEVRVDNVSFRAGYAFYGSPLASGTAPASYSGTNRILSLGFGVRDNDYYLDFGYQNQLTKSYHLPYTLTEQDVAGANVRNYRGSIIATLGCRF